MSDPKPIVVLNSGPSAAANEDGSAGEGAPIVDRLNRLMLMLKADFIDDQGNIDYAGVKASKLFAEYKELARYIYDVYTVGSARIVAYPSQVQFSGRQGGGARGYKFFGAL